MIPTWAIQFGTLLSVAVGFALGWTWRGWRDRQLALEELNEAGHHGGGSQVMLRAARGAFIGLALITVACGGAMAPYKSTSVEATEDPDKLYAATVRLFLRRGWGFQARDPDARAVETEWVEQDGLWGSGGSKVWLAYRVMIGTGRIEVFTSCQMGGLTRRPCPDDERPPGTTAKEQDLAKEIVSEARTLPATERNQ